MKLLIKNGHVLNPQSSFSRMADILIENGKVIEIADNITAADAQVIDARHCLVTPGLIDIHVHLRDPGFPEKETITTGSRSAAAGGFTAVVCMPNTKPSIDSVETLRYILDTATKEASIRVYSSAAISQGLAGKELTNFEDLSAAGAVTFTDDGKTVMDPNLLFEAFTKAAHLHVPISSHCEDHHFVLGGAINRGKISEQIGDIGIHPLGEELMIARDILFAEATGARLHIQHVSSAKGVQLIREAKQRGVKVTAEGAPHHFTITDEIVLEKGALAKVNPPLRTQADVEAVIQGLQDGSLDVIATDHAPHTQEEKSAALAQAPFGLVGLETCVGLTFTYLVHTGKLSVEDAIAKLTVRPAQVMGLPEGSLEIGGEANLTIIDPAHEWVVDSTKFYSKSTNTPFDSFKLKGKAIYTIYQGNIVYQENMREGDRL